jgi:hypothetical protein
MELHETATRKETIRLGFEFSFKISALNEIEKQGGRRYQCQADMSIMAKEH